MRDSNLLTAKPETNEIPIIGDDLKSFRAETVEIACQEARWLGRVFFDALLKIKRLVQDQPTYRIQVEVFSAFTAEGFGLFPDDVLMVLERMIEWKRED